MYKCSVQTRMIFSVHCPQVQGYPHHWKWSLGLQIQRCHLNPWSRSRVESGNLHMDMGMGIVHVVMNVCVCIIVCQESLQ